MEKVLIFDGEKCTGCCICELVCSRTKQKEYNPHKSYIRLVKNKEMDVSIATLDVRCDFCNKCIESCLPKAIRFAELGEAAIVRKVNKIGVFPAPFIQEE